MIRDVIMELVWEVVRGWFDDSWGGTTEARMSF